MWALSPVLRDDCITNTNFYLQRYDDPSLGTEAAVLMGMAAQTLANLSSHHDNRTLMYRAELQVR